MQATLTQPSTVRPQTTLATPPTDSVQRDPRLPGLFNEIRSREIRRRNEAQELSRAGKVENLD